MGTLITSYFCGKLVNEFILIALALLLAEVSFSEVKNK